MKNTTYKIPPKLDEGLHLKSLGDKVKNSSSGFKRSLISLFIAFLFLIGSVSANAQCIGNETVYTLSPSATQAANTISPNGGTVNLVYTRTSGPTIAGLASSFTVPMTYSDLNNTATGVDNRWEGFGTLTSSVYPGSYLSILPITNGTATGSIYANLPTNNRQQELWSNPNNTDNLFTTRIAGGALDLLGDFSLTIGNYPTFPAGVGIVSDELTTMSAGNLVTNGNGYNQGGFWVKPITQTEVFSTPTVAVTVPMAIDLGTTVDFKYSAFSNGTDYVLNTGTRGPGIAGSVTLCSLASTDLGVTKTGPATVNANGTVTYTIVARNNGPLAANGATITDPAVANFTVSSISCTGTTGGAACPSIGSQTTFGTLTLGTFPANSTVTLQVTGTAGSTGTINNRAIIAAPGSVVDLNTGNNESTASTTISQSANLGIVKTVNNPSPAAGSQVIFTITASNLGPSSAAGVVVNDLLPSGYTLVNGTASTGTWSSPNWTIGNLANGANATLTITALVNATGSYANTASISSTTPDPVPGNNSSTVTPNVDLCTVISSVIRK